MKKNAATGFLTLATLVSVGFAMPTFAQTTDVSAQIQALLAQINILQAQLAQLQGQQNGLSCSTFADLSYGNFDISPGGRVSQLQTWLGLPSNTFGFGTYGPKTRTLWHNKCGGSTAHQPNANTPVSTSILTPLPITQDLGTVYFSATFVDYRYTAGDPIVPSIYNQQIIVTNGSKKDVHIKISVDNQPAWLNTSYNTNTLTINSGQPMGIGVSVNPKDLAAGTYKTEIKISGDFAGSPKIIPVTLTVVATPAPTPTIDSFSVNGYSEVTNGRIHVYNVTNPVVQWSSSNASYCRATSVEGLSRVATTDFTGTQQTSGNRQLMIGDSYYNQREITLTCYNQDGVSSNTVIAWIGGKG